MNSIQVFSREHWGLFKALVFRDLEQRYRGTFLGVGWFLLYPLLLLSMYLFVFQVVFSARWSGPIAADTSTIPIPDHFYFAFNLFAGMLVATPFLEVVSRAPRLISEQPQFVKRIVFPLPLLAVVLSVSAWMQALVQWLILLVIIILSLLLTFPLEHLVSLDLTQWLFVQIPLSFALLLTLLPFLFAIATILAAIGTYVKDLSQLSPTIGTGLMFLGPVFYPLASVPESVRWVMLFNPLTIVIEALRGLIFHGYWPMLVTILGYTITGIGVAVCGYLLFTRVQSGFSDVV